MGLFSISPVRRFLDGGESGDVYSGTKLLVSEFLRALQAQNIHFKYGMHPLMREMVLKGAWSRAEEQSTGDDEALQGDPRVVIEPLGTAIETCSSRMAQLPEISRISRGISFGIDVQPSGSKTDWNVIFHRGPLPLLDRIARYHWVPPTSKMVDSIVESKAAHIISKRHSYFGGGDHLFLMLKRFKLFPYSKGNSGREVVAEGQRLRRLCREV